MANNPYVNKIIHGNQTLLDLTSDTVTPSDVRQGVTFHDKSGESKTGSLSDNFEGLYTSSNSYIKKVGDYNEFSKLPTLKSSIKNYLITDVYNRKVDSNISHCLRYKTVPMQEIDFDFRDASDLKKAIWLYEDNTNFITKDGLTRFCTGLQNLESVMIKAANIYFRNNKSGFGEFANCSNLSEVIFICNMLDLNYRTFYNCVNLRELNFGLVKTITKIGNEVFAGCTSLDLTIPDTVTTIGTDAFLNVPHITYNGTATGAPWGALSMN